MRFVLAAAAALVASAPASAAIFTLDFEPGSYTLIEDGDVATYQIGGFNLFVSGHIDGGVLNVTRTFSPAGPGGFNLSTFLPPSAHVVSFDARGTGTASYIDAGGDVPLALTSDFTTFGPLSLSSLTVRFVTDAIQVDNIVIDTGAVPEPATWAMMILGFGAVGGALRKREFLDRRRAAQRIAR